MRFIARYRIKQRIKFHYQMRASIMYARNQSPISIYDYDNHKDELWQRAAAEYRCAQRLERLLTRYL